MVETAHEHAKRLGCICHWIRIREGEDPRQADTMSNCPVHNSESVDRRIDYARIEDIVRRVVREEKGRP